ncbi:MAG TPA: 2-hydroxyacyl-CoA dehydratase family protein, partial [Steroidobacteraceae bacterium]
MNAQVPNYLDHVQCLLVEPLLAARAAARTGTRVVGYIGNDVPVALILAANALPVRLRCDARPSTARADQFLESAFAPEMRSIFEQWLAGELAFVDSVVFPRTDDSAQRLYYYLCELQRRGLCGGPRPLLYEVADIARASSSGYTRESTHRLAQALGTREDLLPSAAQRIAQREALLAEIRARRAAKSPLAGSLGWRVDHANSCDWREEFDTATHHWLKEAPALSGPRRILLAGDPPPDDSLHRVIEDAGGTVVLELTESVAGAMSTQSASIDAIADHFHSRRNPVREMRANGD